MLFLGLGTGLGSALIVEGLVEPLELQLRLADAELGERATLHLRVEFPLMRCGIKGKFFQGNPTMR